MAKFQKLEWSDLGQPSNAVLLPAYTANGMVYTAGHLGNSPTDSSSFPSTIEEQTELALKNLEVTLKACGSSLDSCVKLLVFIKDGADQPRMNSVYTKIMTSKPARSCVVVGFPNPKVLVEIEAVAVQTGSMVKSKL